MRIKKINRHKKSPLSKMTAEIFVIVNISRKIANAVDSTWGLKYNLYKK